MSSPFVFAKFQCLVVQFHFDPQIFCWCSPPWILGPLTSQFFERLVAVWLYHSCSTDSCRLYRFIQSHHIPRYPPKMLGVIIILPFLLV